MSLLTDIPKLLTSTNNLATTIGTLGTKVNSLISTFSGAATQLGKLTTIANQLDPNTAGTLAYNVINSAKLFVPSSFTDYNAESCMLMNRMSMPYADSEYYIRDMNDTGCISQFEGFTPEELSNNIPFAKYITTPIIKALNDIGVPDFSGITIPAPSIDLSSISSAITDALPDFPSVSGILTDIGKVVTDPIKTAIGAIKMPTIPFPDFTTVVVDPIKTAIGGIKMPAVPSLTDLTTTITTPVTKAIGEIKMPDLSIINEKVKTMASGIVDSTTLIANLMQNFGFIPCARELTDMDDKMGDILFALQQLAVFMKMIGSANKSGPALSSTGVSVTASKFMPLYATCKGTYPVFDKANYGPTGEEAADMAALNAYCKGKENCYLNDAYSSVFHDTDPIQDEVFSGHYKCQTNIEPWTWAEQKGTSFPLSKTAQINQSTSASLILPASFGPPVLAYSTGISNALTDAINNHISKNFAVGKTNYGDISYLMPTKTVSTLENKSMSFDTYSSVTLPASSTSPTISIKLYTPGVPSTYSFNDVPLKMFDPYGNPGGIWRGDYVSVWKAVMDWYGDGRSNIWDMSSSFYYMGWKQPGKYFIPCDYLPCSMYKSWGGWDGCYVRVSGTRITEIDIAQYIRPYIPTGSSLNMTNWWIYERLPSDISYLAINGEKAFKGDYYYTIGSTTTVREAYTLNTTVKYFVSTQTAEPQTLAGCKQACIDNAGCKAMTLYNPQPETGLGLCYISPTTDAAFSVADPLGNSYVITRLDASGSCGAWSCTNAIYNKYVGKFVGAAPSVFVDMITLMEAIVAADTANIIKFANQIDTKDPYTTYYYENIIGTLANARSKIDAVKTAVVGLNTLIPGNSSGYSAEGTAAFYNQVDTVIPPLIQAAIDAIVDIHAHTDKIMVKLENTQAGLLSIMPDLVGSLNKLSTTAVSAVTTMQEIPTKLDAITTAVTSIPKTLNTDGLTDVVAAAIAKAVQTLISQLTMEGATGDVSTAFAGFLERLQPTLSKIISVALEGIGTNLGGLSTAITDAVTKASTDIATQLSLQLGTTFTPMFEQLIGAISPAVNAAVSALVQGMSASLELIVPAITQSISGLSSIGEGISSTISTALAPLRGAAEALSAYGNLPGEILTGIKSLETAATTLTTQLKDMPTMMVTLIDKLTTLVGLLPNFMETSSAFLTGAVDSLGLIAQHFPTLATAATTMMTNIATMVAKIMEPGSPSMLDNTKTLLAHLVNGITTVIDNAPGFMSSAVTIIPKLTDALTQIASNFPTLAGAATTMMTGLADFISRISEGSPSIIDKSVTVITGLANAITKLVAGSPSILDNAQILLGYIIDTFVAILERTPQFIDAATKIIPELMEAFMKIASNFPDLAMAIINMATGLAEFIAKLSTGNPSIIDNAAAIISSIIRAITYIISHAPQGFAYVMENLGFVWSDETGGYTCPEPADGSSTPCSFLVASVPAGWNWTRENVPAAYQWTKGAAQSTYTFLRENVPPAYQWTKENAKAIYDFVRVRVPPAWTWIKENAKATYDWLAMNIPIAWAFIRKNAPILYAWLAEHIPKAIQGVKDAIVYLENFARNLKTYMIYVLIIIVAIICTYFYSVFFKTYKVTIVAPVNLVPGSTVLIK